MSEISDSTTGENLPRKDIDTLTNQLIDGPWTEDEAKDLAWRLQLYPEEAEKVVDMLAMEARLKSLEAQEVKAEAAAAILNQIEASGYTVHDAVDDPAADVDARLPLFEGDKPAGHSHGSLNTNYPRLAPQSDRANGNVGSEASTHNPGMRRSGWMRQGLMAAACIQLAIFIWMVGLHFRTDTGSGPLVTIQADKLNQLTYWRDGKSVDLKTDALTVQFRMQSGDVLRTQAQSMTYADRPLWGDSGVTISYADGTRIGLFGGAEVSQIDELGNVLSLAKGEINASVSPRQSESQLVIHSPHATATILGTQFRLKAEENSTRLEVNRGEVELKRLDGVRAIVKKNQYAVAASYRKLEAKPQPRREVTGLLALYRFVRPAEAVEKSPLVIRNLAPDKAGLDLRIKSQKHMEWVNQSKDPLALNGSLQVNGPVKIQTKGNADLLKNACMSSRAITVEAWVTPSQRFQYGPARLVTMSKTSVKANFILGHGYDSKTPDNYVFRVTTPKSPKGTPSLNSPAGATVTELTHLLCTHSEGETSMYINGQLVARRKESVIDNWQSLPLAIGNDPSEDKSWLGTFHLVAIYDQGFDQAKVSHHYQWGLEQFAH